MQSFTCQGQRYVVKYQQPSRTRYLRSWMASAACAFLFNEIVRPARLRSGDVGHEATRLRSLRSQGVRVPEVILQTPDCLILEYCGKNLARVIKHAAQSEREALLVRVIDELAEFHRAGHWHGGAQLRNLTLHQGKIYRIDFEEAAGMFMPRELAQAYDVLLTFHSFIDYFGGNIELGSSLLNRYFQRAPSDQVASSLRCLERKLGWWIRLEPLLGGLAHRHKDIRSAFALTRVLQNR
ncbi:MAG: RIO1 family regulatory kinase/ATPase [Pusillimonas sp.]